MIPSSISSTTAAVDDGSAPPLCHGNGEGAPASGARWCSARSGDVPTMPGGLRLPASRCDMVLALAVLDAVVGTSLVVEGVLSDSADSRYVGTALLLCAAVLAAVPWLTEAADAVSPLVDSSRT